MALVESGNMKIPGLNSGYFINHIKKLQAGPISNVIAFELNDNILNSNAYIFGIKKNIVNECQQSEIIGLYVPPIMQRKGYGMLLVTMFENKVREIGEESKTSSLSITVVAVHCSIEFWKQQNIGFTQSSLSNGTANCSFEKYISW